MHKAIWSSTTTINIVRSNYRSILQLLHSCAHAETKNTRVSVCFVTTCGTISTTGKNSDCFFAFGGADIGSSHVAAAGPGESSNESAGETLDVEGFGGGGPGGGGGGGPGGGAFGSGLGGIGMALGDAAGGALAPTWPGVGTAGPATARGSRGIGIGIGVAAGVATAHRGMKRELSDTNLDGGGGAGGDGGSGAWGGVGDDVSRRSMSEQQKLERRVSWRLGWRSVREQEEATRGMHTWLYRAPHYDTAVD